MWIPFDQMPEQARIWVYQANRLMTPEEQQFITTKMHAFCTQWEAHGNALRTSFHMCYNHFLVLAVDEEMNSVSGCSIDQSVKVLQACRESLKIDFFDRSKVAFWIDGTIRLHAVPELKKLFDAGVLEASTPTFNNTVINKGELETKWRIPVEKSWLNKYLFHNQEN